MVRTDSQRFLQRLFDSPMVVRMYALRSGEPIPYHTKHGVSGSWFVGLLGVTFAMVGCGARTALEVEENADASTMDVALVDAPTERCDGDDNDGDGRIDEGLATVTCGVGACRRTACDARQCVPGEPTDELCGGGDDDCDGIIDEGLMLGPLGPALDVREGAGGYDRCGTCSWAYDPILTPRDDGLFVAWSHGIYGGEEIPNLWGRRLDDIGAPVGEPEPIGSRVRLSAQRIRGLDVRDGLTVASERVGSGDVTRLWRHAPWQVEQVEADLACSGALDFVFTEGRLVSACTSRGEARIRSQVPGGPADTLSLDVDDTFYGAALHVHPDDGEVLVAAYYVGEDDDRWMSFARLSPTLDMVQPLTRSEAAYTRGDVAFAVPEGWIWWNVHGSDNVRGEMLDRAGQVVRELAPYPFRTSNPPLAHTALGGGQHLILLRSGNPMPLRLVRIDEEGAVLQFSEIEVPPNPAGQPDYASHIDFIEYEGAFWAAWIGSYPADAEPNHVNVQRFGCVEP